MLWTTLGYEEVECRSGSEPMPWRISYEPDRSALAAALHYFDAGAPHHTADEERSVFPKRRNAALDARELLESLMTVKVRLSNADLAVSTGREWSCRTRSPSPEPKSVE